MSGRKEFEILIYLILFIIKGRAGRTGQSQTGECYVIAHEKDMKQVKEFSKKNLFIYFLLISFEKCYLL